MRLGVLLALLLLMACRSVTGGEDRVAEARKAKGALLKATFSRSGLPYPADRVHLRAFKSERRLEVWVGQPGKRKRFKTYPIAAISGGLGPKKEQGDLQVPEGIYRIDRFNPRSRFLLSLGLNYPNATDRQRSKSRNPGGDIFIHGGRASIGCLAMTDEVIQEIYLIALDAKSKPVTIEVFPMRMEGKTYDAAYQKAPQEWRTLWKVLEKAYLNFS